MTIVSISTVKWRHLHSSPNKCNCVFVSPKFFIASLCYGRRNEMTHRLSISVRQRDHTKCISIRSCHSFSLHSFFSTFEFIVDLNTWICLIRIHLLGFDSYRLLSLKRQTKKKKKFESKQPTKKTTTSSISFHFLCVIGIVGTFSSSVWRCIFYFVLSSIGRSTFICLFGNFFSLFHFNVLFKWNFILVFFLFISMPYHSDRFVMKLDFLINSRYFSSIHNDIVLSIWSEMSNAY